MTALGSLTLHDYLAQVAAKVPAPGGGAVACSTGATAAAIGRMVVAYSLKKKALAEHEPALQRADRSLARASDLFLALADEDAAAYGLVNELSRLAPEDPRRAAEYATAVEAAVAAPRAALGAAGDLLRLFETLPTITNRHLRSDLAIAAILAEAAAKSAWWNVAVNLELIEDQAKRSGIRADAQGMVEQAAVRRAVIEKACTA